MKKSFILLLSLVLLFAGIACYAQETLLKEKDQVHYTENVVYGDKSVVDGVIIETDVSYDYQIFWNTVYQIGEKPKEETDYEFHAIRVYDNRYSYAGSISFVPNASNIQSDPEVFLDGKEYTGLMGAFQDLYESTPLGATNTAIVYLKEYADYYTFDIDLNLPAYEGETPDAYHNYRFMSETELKENLENLEKTGETESDEYKELKEYMYILETFQSYFKIPVLENEVCAIGLIKDENGLVTGWAESDSQGGMSSGDMDFPEMPDVEGADHFNIGIRSVFIDGDCYMTFDTHTYNGKLVDTSLIPGGYGLYHFIYDEKTGKINVDNLEMVYPLDTNCSIVDMISDESKKNILLFTESESQFYLDIIDIETMTLKDTFSLGSNEAYLSSWTYDDFLVVSAENLMVFPMGEDGRYTQAFSVSNEKINDIFSWDTTYDWNGETLLAANRIAVEGIDGWRGSYTCNFYVAAVNETGLLYYGEYASSLQSADLENGYYESCLFNPDKEDHIRIRWN